MTNNQPNPPTKKTTDNRGVTCELWTIPGHSRYYLARRNGQWSVYDRLKKRPVTRYTIQAKSCYYAYRLVSNAGKINRQSEHRLVMSCLSLEEPKFFIFHLDKNALNNTFENLYYCDRKRNNIVRNSGTGQIHSGTLEDIRLSARIGHAKIAKILRGEYVPGYELINKHE